MIHKNKPLKYKASGIARKGWKWKKKNDESK